MTGFIRGLFGGKGGGAPQPPRSKEAFFLSEDEAKTFGDIDFMRKEVVVKRTFAKKKGEAEELESVRSISAMSKVDLDEAAQPGATSFSADVPYRPRTASSPQPQASTGASSTSSSAPSAPQKKMNTDTSMDMFRNMAKNIKKR